MVFRGSYGPQISKNSTILTIPEPIPGCSIWTAEPLHISGFIRRTGLMAKVYAIYLAVKNTSYSRLFLSSEWWFPIFEEGPDPSKLNRLVQKLCRILRGNTFPQGVVHGFRLVFLLTIIGRYNTRAATLAMIIRIVLLYRIAPIQSPCRLMKRLPSLSLLVSPTRSLWSISLPGFGVVHAANSSTGPLWDLDDTVRIGNPED